MMPEKVGALGAEKDGGDKSIRSGTDPVRIP
jgi:hypothetical protein